MCIKDTPRVILYISSTKKVQTKSRVEYLKLTQSSSIRDKNSMRSYFKSVHHIRVVM